MDSKHTRFSRLHNMKHFVIEMLDGGGDVIAVQVHGQGTVGFATVPITYERTEALRKHCAKRLGELGDDMENDVAIGLVYELTVHVVRETLKPKLTLDQASQIIGITGGVRGDLVTELLIRFGVSDILLNRPDDGPEGMQEELPT